MERKQRSNLQYEIGDLHKQQQHLVSVRGREGGREEGRERGREGGRERGRERWRAIVTTVEPDLIATEMLAFPSKSSRNTNDSNLMIAI